MDLPRYIFLVQFSLLCFSSSTYASRSVNILPGCSDLVDSTLKILSTPGDGLFRPGDNVKPAKGGCFSGDVAIETPTGRKAISEIKVNDEVWGWDHKTKQRVRRKVVKVISFEEVDVCDLRFDSVTIQGVTAYHPFYVMNNSDDLHTKGFVYKPLAKLFNEKEQKSMAKLGKDGNLSEVTVLEYSNRKTTIVYNIEVDGTRNYFAEGILVHNKRD